LDVQFAFLCDAAQESGGKLHALGIGIDRLTAREVPVTHPAMTVVVAVRYAAAEAGKKTLAVRVLDADGQNVMPPVDGEVVLPDPKRSTRGQFRLTLTLGGIKFQKFGDHAVQIALNGISVANLPLSVTQASPDEG
jgi:hypothetical protein